jgi:hypothetical protein
VAGVWRVGLAGGLVSEGGGGAENKRRSFNPRSDGLAGRPDDSIFIQWKNNSLLVEEIEMPKNGCSDNNAA